MGNPVAWGEIMGKDAASLKRFYTKVFGWKYEEYPDVNYASVETEGPQLPGAGLGIGIDPEGATRATIYLGVDDVAATLGTIKNSGGTIVMDEMTVMENVTFGMFTDPEGNLLGLLKNVSM